MTDTAKSTAAVFAALKSKIDEVERALSTERENVARERRLYQASLTFPTPVSRKRLANIPTATLDAGTLHLAASCRRPDVGESWPRGSALGREEIGRGVLQRHGVQNHQISKFCPANKWAPRNTPDSRSSRR